MFVLLIRKLQDVRQRINALYNADHPRPLPKTRDATVLGQELKVRLACTSPLLMQKTSSTGRIFICETWRKERFVPILEIEKNQDCVLACSVKVPMHIPPAVLQRRQRL